MSSSRGTISSGKRVMSINYCNVPSSTEDMISSKISLERRELRMLKEKQAIELEDNRVSPLTVEEIQNTILKIKDLKLLSKSLYDEQNRNKPVNRSKKQPFDSTETRDCNKDIKVNNAPIFYRGEHEWDFGMESGSRYV